MKYPIAFALSAVVSAAGPVLAQESPLTPVGPPVAPSPAPAPAYPPAPLPAAVPVAPQQPGSLYSEGVFQALTADRHHRKVGDLVTVIVYENASASSTADTGANHDQSLGVTANSWTFGQRGAGIGTTNDFNGGGRTARAGRLLAQITVSVREVLANQDLVIGGEQVVEINGEKQVIHLDGRVRASDISELNTVLSSRVADAKISFVGDGVVGERQRPGWWHQLLTLFGL